MMTADGRVFAAMLGAALLLPPDTPAQVVAPGSPGATLHPASPPFALPSPLRDSVRFAWLDVPQVHGDPAAGTLRLALTILPARTASPAEPIVFIPGGPGMATVEPWTAEAAQSDRIALLRERHDFVILDPRGHGLSEPHTCPELDAAAPWVDDSSAAEATFTAKLRACRARLIAAGARLDALNAVEAAHDVELLRRALGEGRINLFGASYGTRIAAEVVRRYPDAIRAVVFLSPVPPALPHLGDDADAADEVLGRLFRRCRQLPACNEEYPRLPAAHDSLLARVRRKPFLVQIPPSDRLPSGAIEINERLLREGLGGLLVERRLAAGVPMLIDALANHGLDRVAAMAPRLAQMLQDDALAFGTHLAFHCNDALIGLERVAWLDGRCGAWIGEAYGDRAAEPLRSDVPALIMVGELDPRTPPSYARYLAAGLPNGRVIEIPGHGHDLRHPCISRIQQRFFAEPDAAPDLGCLDSLPPLRVARRVTPNRWMAAMSTRVAERPPLAAAAAVPAALLLVALVGLPLSARRRRHGGGLPWLAAAAALVLMAGALAAMWIGSLQSPLVPAVGLPHGWGWIGWMPWVVAGLLTASAVTVLRRPRDDGRVPAWLIACALVGAGLVLATVMLI